MKEDEILSGLEKLVESMNVALRYEKGDFAGGYCVLRDKPMIIIQNNLSSAAKIRILAKELAHMNLENVFIVPALRDVIDEAAGQGAIQLESHNREGTPN